MSTETEALLARLETERQRLEQNLAGAEMAVERAKAQHAAIIGALQYHELVMRLALEVANAGVEQPGTGAAGAATAADPGSDSRAAADAGSPATPPSE